MKKLITLMAVLLVVLSLGAEVKYSVGFEAGPDYNMVIAGKGYRNYEYKGGLNLTASVPVLIEFTPSLGLQTGISYSEKQYDYKRAAKNSLMGSAYVVDTIDYTLYNEFLELPVAFRYTFNFGESDWAVYGTAGGFVGWWLRGRRMGLAYSTALEAGLTQIDESVNFDYYNRFEAGINASVGVRWQFAQKWEAHVQFGYSLALTDMNRYQKHGAYPIHNSTFSITGGIMWGINK